ncbi:hypothetical protein CO057_00445 [Candidatus Uhrbacteria bacterium CG_4_9_14_0_2_um_filter_41_50]|uniref:Uncharacterized protein n=1 Tax=Candidatus Uhrbacteria bacterium CG_4_9_14_0_2_um_filter_41_50 TaxID=1975031 RepID=A0A2M8EQB6_9BACT|nr:MAG: hypothetical protein COZ45_02220 [Candidatus Uhrbacteria bacterium CG_4_10_14_3_um_filter_41_21]PIZ54482.1 MAG: hypothetical protein COY24_03580 [Candidatus Uhrbacteria bacterium CG_4_10_14_0_2_um_filter_41_21]PJB84832.1 MAG: hypothetical protein CO086_01425 [Candidatus Uhrbacteria bacterium CG_4_9_14_0_8_um_filter_41_16]PJC24877.1 MAG: hypothetical protein CO057_00445 [Candidatus Uhrbacteria bacterium CG_4_9_14_0_2_um_filter_41_50]PJE75217.1 MAG: hypothetical protein COV03_01085 [Candi
MRIESSRKKERLVFLITAVGIVFVLIIWGFQLNEMFRDVTGEAIPEDVGSTADDLQAAVELSDQMKETIPFLQTSLNDILDQAWKNKTEEATDSALLEIGNQLNNELERQSQEGQENAPENGAVEATQPESAT